MAPRRSGDVSQNEVALAQARAQEAQARAMDAEENRKLAEILAPGEGRSVRCHVRLRGKEQQLSNDAVMFLAGAGLWIKNLAESLMHAFRGRQKAD